MRQGVLEHLLKNNNILTFDQYDRLPDETKVDLASTHEMQVFAGLADVRNIYPGRLTREVAARLSAAIALANSFDTIVPPGLDAVRHSLAKKGLGLSIQKNADSGSLYWLGQEDATTRGYFERNSAKQTVDVERASVRQVAESLSEDKVTVVYGTSGVLDRTFF